MKLKEALERLEQKNLTSIITLMSIQELLI